MPTRTTNTIAPPSQRSRLRLRSRKVVLRGAGRRERRVARLAGLGRRDDVVKVSLVRRGGGSAWKSARSLLIEPGGGGRGAQPTVQQRRQRGDEHRDHELAVDHGQGDR